MGSVRSTKQKAPHDAGLFASSHSPERFRRISLGGSKESAPLTCTVFRRPISDAVDDSNSRFKTLNAVRKYRTLNQSFVLV